MEDGEFSIYSLDEFAGDDGEAASALDRLRKHMETVFANVDIIVLDGLTGLVNGAGTVPSASFFTECRFFCSPKTAVIISLDATHVDPSVLGHLEEMAGNHVSLQVGSFADGAENKAMSKMLTIKVKGTTLRTNSIICFAVDPELARSMEMSLKVLPEAGFRPGSSSISR